MLPHFIVWVFSVGMMVLGTSVLFGQTYPNKPIRLVVSEAGGTSDFAARLIAPDLIHSLGQQVIVDNRGGAGGAIAAEIVARTSPDGYTLLVCGTNIWLLPLLQKNVAYDPVKDFAPITLSLRAPNILVVPLSLPVKSVKELIAFAKTKPAGLNYASGSTGASSHLAAELFKSMAGVNMVRIPYKGGGPALNDLIAGQVQLMFPSAGAVAPHVKSGSLRALAVASAEPSALAPDLPTIAASGLPGYEASSTIGVFAPAHTPAALINRLNHEFVRALSRPEMKERLINTGVEVINSSPAEFAATVKSDVAKWGKVIRDGGIRAD